MLIPIDKILKNPEQPRAEIPAESLAELADSIRMHGLINPIAVEEAGDLYILIDGERRWRAAKMAGLTEIEASIRPGLNGSGQVERLVLATVANLQREDMNPVDKALAFQKLVDAGMTQVEVAKTVGLSQISISNYLLILRIPVKLQKHIASGILPSDPRVLRALLDIEDAGVQQTIANAAARRKMTTTGVLGLITRSQGKKTQAKRSKAKSRMELSVTWNRRWNMIAQAGNPSLSPEIRAAALEVCSLCPLIDDASPKYCTGCAGPELLKRIIREASPKGKGANDAK